MRRGLLALAATLLAATLAADPAAARRAPCAEGAKQPLCMFQDARAVFIADGDTIRVSLGGRLQNVRFTGINAMELTRYSKYPGRRRGACHGLEATAFVERAIKRSGWKVRLAAQKLSSRAEKRLRRSVWVKQGGRWRDLAKLELQAGLALWLPNHVEHAHNREYAVLAQKAAAARKALYDPGACGAGPDQDLPIGVTVNWDADGNDAQDLNGEWVDIHNGGARELRLGGWWVRDSYLRFGRGRVPGYPLPASTVVPAGETLRVRIGCGAASALEQHWCLNESAFENVGALAPGMGDGAYLFDPQGDLRAWQIYPCLVACSDPLAGKVELSAQPRGDESISIANTSGEPVDLGGHVVKLHNAGKPDQFVFGYPFKAGTALAPGETMVLDPGGSPSDDTRLERHAGRGSFVLADGKGVVSLRTTDDLVTDCTSWGGRLVPVNLRGKLESVEHAIGLWASIPSALTAEAAALAGPDYVVADQQHGALDPATLMAMLTAIAGAGAAPLVRVARNEPFPIGQALDLGAQGVIVPMVESAEEAAAAVAACRYAPEGIRSFGALRAGAGERPLCLVMIETRAGLEHAAAIAATPGLDGVYIGPSDLALSLGLQPTIRLEHPPVLEALAVIHAACADAGVVAGVHCLAAEDVPAQAERFAMVTAGGDTLLLQGAAAAALRVARGG